MGRLSDHCRPRCAPRDDVILHHVIRAGQYERRKFLRGRRARRPLATEAQIKEDRPPQPDSPEHVGQNVFPRQAFHLLVSGIPAARARTLESRTHSSQCGLWRIFALLPNACQLAGAGNECVACTNLPDPLRATITSA